MLGLFVQGLDMLVEMSLELSGSNLRDALFAGERVWCDEIDEVLEMLDVGILGDSWVINDGIYKKGEMWHPPISEKYEPNKRRHGSSSSAQFSFHPSCVHTQWLKHTRHFSVKYGSTAWDSRRSTETNQFGPRENGPSGFFTQTNSTRFSRYSPLFLIENSKDCLKKHRQLELDIDEAITN